MKRRGLQHKEGHRTRHTSSSLIQPPTGHGRAESAPTTEVQYKLEEIWRRPRSSKGRSLRGFCGPCPKTEKGEGEHDHFSPPAVKRPMKLEGYDYSTNKTPAPNNSGMDRAGKSLLSWTATVPFSGQKLACKVTMRNILSIIHGYNFCTKVSQSKHSN